MGEVTKSTSTEDRLHSVEFVRIPRFTFKPTGIRLTEDQQDGRNFTRGPMFYVGFTGLVWCISCESIFCALATSRGQADFRQNMYIVACVVSLCLAFFFCIKIIYHKHQFVAIAKKFEQCFPKTLEEQKMYRVTSWVKQTNMKMLLYGATQIIAIGGFNAFPLSDIVVVYFRDHRWEVDFLFPLWYPFDPYVRGVFEFCYFFEIFTW